MVSSSISSTSTWVDRMHMIPLATPPSKEYTINRTTKDNNESKIDHERRNDISSHKSLEFTITSFNVLAESYLSPRSHPGLPPSYANVAFDTEKRRKLLLDTLKRFCCSTLTNATNSMQQEHLSRSKSRTSLESISQSSDAFKHTKWDIIALQELDFLQPNDPILPALSNWGYNVIHTPNDQRKDCCAVAFDKSKFRLVEYQVVKFDVVASLYEQNDDTVEGERSKEIDDNTTNANCVNNRKTTKLKKSHPASELTGLVRSFLRRNCAIIVHLETCDEEKQSLIVASTHLYWHPRYEYVKLCQAKYLLDRVYEMATRGYNAKRIPTIICGDMNSKPGSVVHQLFVNSHVDARIVAPWHYFWDSDRETMYPEEEDENDLYERIDGQDPILTSDSFDSLDDNLGIENYSKNEEKSEFEFEKYCQITMPAINDSIDCHACDTNEVEIRPNNHLDIEISESATPGSTLIEPPSTRVNNQIDSDYYDLQTRLLSRRLHGHKSPQDYQHFTPTSQVKYMLDYTLNRFTRWLRILGIDAVLETESEEKERTKGNRIALFEHCKNEHRTLITTSYKLLLRKDCPPGTYLLDPKSIAHLEQALPRLLRTHGVELSPCVFLTRCVVCNGSIHRVLTDEEKRIVFKEHGAPNLIESKGEMEVFRCTGCRQGYWWDDRPNSSASRVFTQATRLLRLCLKGGVKLKNESVTDESMRKDIMGAFHFVDAEMEREAQEFGQTHEGPELCVIKWLRDSELQNPLQLRSAYASKTDTQLNGSFPRETLSFSNVTSEFVGLLDYVFFESSQFEQLGTLHVPTSFREMNSNGIFKGHLLPSDIWPSDHLAVGAHLRLKNGISTKTEIEEQNPNLQPTDNFPAKEVRNLHPPRCACGCIPNIPSLFEMAELRKKAREAAKAEAVKSSESK